MLYKSSVPIIEPHYFSCQAWQLYHKENLIIHITYKTLKENSVLEQQHPIDQIAQNIRLSIIKIFSFNLPVRNTPRYPV